MATRRIYLDHNAGSPPREEAVQAALEAMRAGGNPSSVHAEGRAARARVEAARVAVAALAGVPAGQVVFTASATEANVTALSADWVAGARALRLERLLVSATEHPSVLRGGRFPADRVEVVPVGPDGVLRLDDLAARLAAGTGPALVAVQAANSETGVLQPIGEIARLVRAAGGVLVCDAVQAAGRLPIEELDADVLTLSAHKIGGIQGAGALVARKAELRPLPLLPGGGQEANRRGGTEAVPAIAAFGAAALAARQDLERIEQVRAERDWLIGALRSISGTVTVFGETADRLANTASVALPGLPAETAVIAFDLEGVAISSGSACSSGKVAASHVLKAMAVPADLVRNALRVSLGWSTTREDLEGFVAVWRKLAARVQTDRGRAA
ncbi:cysteine desulfurase family protein [Prosthecomicrobium sp. N25]|uniref:cysteine desulfurase family protein n=1 Tax=Prosthecomicrobium sp. N25 TaxID=3129254 RepID=UPI003076BB94